MARARRSSTLATAASGGGKLVAVEPAPSRPPSAAKRGAGRVTGPAIMVDRYRAFVFPNRIREQRRRLGLQKLMALSELLPDFPYIRLSKIERGEVVARAGEVKRIAHALGVQPIDLLSNVTDPDFDIARWAEPFVDAKPVSQREECMAVLLAAALRVRRNTNASLTIATLDQDYGLPPVILSRLENAHKTLDRWNAATIASLCRLFDVADEAALRALVDRQYQAGALNGYVDRIANPETRSARTRAVIAALRAELAPQSLRASARTARAAKLAPPKPSASDSAPDAVVSPPAPTTSASPRMLDVFGTPLPGGLIALTRSDDRIEAPQRAGPRAFALRVCRATLGAGLPAQAIVIVDPDRAPIAGGLAAIRSAAGHRLVSVTFDRMGATKGYSVVPDLEIDIDALDPADVAAVIAAIFP